MSSLVKNLVSLKMNDVTTVHTITSDATVLFYTPLSQPLNSWQLQSVWVGLTGTLDGSLTVVTSNDGINWSTDARFDPIIMSSAANNGGFQEEIFGGQYFGILLTKNTMDVAGTILLTLSYKSED
jgi:hypothetical protein